MLRNLGMVGFRGRERIDRERLGSGVQRQSKKKSKRKSKPPGVISYAGRM